MGAAGIVPNRGLGGSRTRQRLDLITPTPGGQPGHETSLKQEGKILVGSPPNPKLL